MPKNKQSGFTVVELLVVIIVIGILTIISAVAYNGVSQKANGSTLKSDLSNASSRLGLDNATNGYYPISEAAANDGKGLPKSAGTTYSYTLIGNNYCLGATSSTAGSSAYHIWSPNGSVEDGPCNYSQSLVTNLIAYWEMDETSGTTARDSMGLYNGTTTGSTVNQPGKIGTSYKFNETSNYVYLPLNLAINTATTGYTFSAWIYAEAKASAGGWSAVIMDWEAGGKNSATFGLSISNGTAPTKIGAWTGGNQGTAPTVGTLTTGWHHIVGVWTASTPFTPVMMYFDGAYVGNSVTDRAATWSGTRDFGLGTTYVSYDTFYKGSIDEIGIWTRALSPTEISTLYNNGSGLQYP